MPTPAATDRSTKDDFRAREIEREVQDRNGIWDAYDQGRWAYAKGFPVTDNNHVEWHVNHSEWRRGWLMEQAVATDDQQFIASFGYSQ